MNALKLKKNRPVDFYLIREAEFAKKTKNEENRWIDQGWAQKLDNFDEIIDSF